MRHRNRLGEHFDGVLAAAQTGGGWAFERIWRAYAPAVAAYLRSQGAPDAEDLVSDVFLGAHRTLGSFSGDEAAFRSWLFTIAHRRLVDARRVAARRPSPEPLSPDVPLEDPEAGPELEVLRRAAQARVRQLCDRLAADQRDVLLLRLLGGCTVVEVATTLGKTSGGVKALQRRGLASLRQILEREGVPL